MLIDLENPTDQAQSLSLTFKRGGTEQRLSFGPGERRVVRINFDRKAPIITDWSNIREITITDMMPTREQAWLIRRISLFCDEPATTELGRLRGLMEKTQKQFDEAQSAGALSDTEKTNGAKVLAKWGTALESSAGIRGKSQACRRALAALESRSRVALMSKQFKGTQVLWSVPLGTRFEPAGAMVQYRRPLEKLHLYAAAGEYQNGIVRVTNLSDSVQDWKVGIASETPAVSSALNIRRNQTVLAFDHSVVGDVLTPLDGAGVLSVAPGETAELWITVDVKHHAWKSGTHEAQLVLKDLRRGDASIVKLPVEVTIRNFSVADAPTMHLNMWSFLYYQHTSLLDGKEEAALKNLVDYGCDVFVLNGWQLPRPKLDASGNPLAEMDFTFFDKLVKFYRSRNKSTILINLAMDDVKPEWRALNSGLEVYSSAWEKGMRYYLEQFVSRMEDLGVPKGQYAFYITDEPDREELDFTRRVGKIIKSIDPAIQIYTDTSELYDDPKLNDELLNLVSINQFNSDSTGMLQTMLDTLKEHPDVQSWAYACRLHTRAGDVTDAYDYYRLMAWRAQRDGMNGIGYWIYLYDAAADLWDGSLPDGGASVIYPDSGKGILMSPRWELIRTSLDDVKYYRLLEKAERTPAIDQLLGKRFEEVIAHRHDPELAVQWRVDAGAAIEAAKK
jgi:hypothetical protein